MKHKWVTTVQVKKQNINSFLEDPSKILCHAAVGSHLDCSQFGIILNNTALNVMYTALNVCAHTFLLYSSWVKQ